MRRILQPSEFIEHTLGYYRSAQALCQQGRRRLKSVNDELMRGNRVVQKKYHAGTNNGPGKPHENLKPYPKSLSYPLTAKEAPLVTQVCQPKRMFVPNLSGLNLQERGLLAQKCLSLASNTRVLPRGR